MADDLLLHAPVQVIRDAALMAGRVVRGQHSGPTWDLRPLIEQAVPVRIARCQYATDITLTSLGEALREMGELASLRRA